MDPKSTQSLLLKVNNRIKQNFYLLIIELMIWLVKGDEEQSQLLKEEEQIKLKRLTIAKNVNRKGLNKIEIDEDGNSSRYRYLRFGHTKGNRNAVISQC